MKSFFEWVGIAAIDLYVIWTIGTALSRRKARREAKHRAEEKRLIGVPERRRIVRPDADSRPQVPHQSDGGRP